MLTPAPTRLGLPLLAALAGSVLLFVLYPRVHPAARWGYQYGREGAIERGRAIARSQHVDTAAWPVFVTADYRGKLEFYRKLHPEDKSAQPISPALITVAFASPDKRRAFGAQLYPDGRTAGWEQKVELTDRAGPYTPMVSARAAAFTAFQVIAGGEAAAFHLSTDAAGTKQGSRFTWERASPSAGFQPTIDIVVNKGEVIRAETHLAFSKDVEREYAGRRTATDWFAIPYFVLYFIMVVAAAVFYTLGAIQGKVKHRFAIAFALVNAAFVLLAFVTGSGPDAIRSSVALDNQQSAVEFSGVALEVIGNALFAWVVAGAGLFIAGALGGKWWSLRLLFTSKIISRPVGWSLAAGALWGPALAAVPPVTAAFFPEASWAHRPQDEIFCRSLVLQALKHPLHSTLIGLFGVLLAFILIRIRSGWARWPLFTLVGVLFFIGFGGYFKDSAPANVLAGGLTLALTFVLFRRFDLLAVATAATVAILLQMASVLFLQPSPVLRQTAWHLLAFGGAMLVAGLTMIRMAPDAPDEEDATNLPIARGIVSAREELKSEFSVARRAQREMLPAKPPATPGFSLAAHCTPAKDVGGDLYDFLPLKNGRLAIAVADVSGKGVPAALYMTLTKGLLAAATQDDLDLASILEHINKHLHDVCRRKTFVTMALGILDPVARSFEYARAGHNPAVWRSPSSGPTRLLNSRGIGLGITAGAVFGRTLAVERVNLTPGDTLVFYSDGLTEAMNPQLEQFGEDRLIEIVDRVDGSSAAQLRDSILAEVTRFLAGNHPQDDLTLVVLRVE